MSWADALENVNYLGVVFGTVAALIIGALWYAPGAFGKMWADLIGLKKKDMEDRSGMAVMMTMSVVFYALVSLTTAALYEMTAANGVVEGLLLGAILGFIFGFGPMSVTYGFARRKFELSLVDGGYIVTTCAVIGAIVGYMG